VVRAAAELANREGSAALTINRLAAQLGIQPPSLYNHIGGLAALQRELALLNARQLGECLGRAALGRAGAPALLALAHAYRDYIKQNPGVYLASLQASGTHEQPDPELAAAEGQVVQVVMAVMESFGLRGEDGLHAVRGLRSMVHGFASLEIAGGFGLPLDCDESFNRLLALLIRGLQPELLPFAPPR
jgi:AcrR family transcriptional regulator